MRSRVIPARALCKFSSSQPAFFIIQSPDPGGATGQSPVRALLKLSSRESVSWGDCDEYKNIRIRRGEHITSSLTLLVRRNLFIHRR